MADLPGVIARGRSEFIDAPGGFAANYAGPAQRTSVGAVAAPGRPVVGASAVASPKASVSVVNRSGFCAFGFGREWFNKVHVVPRAFAFGNIVGTIVDTVDIFSAFIGQDITFSSFVNNVGTGLTITNLPSLPATIGPLSGLTLNIQVTTDGDPQFNTTLDFVFSVGTVQVTVSGSRVIMFPYRPIAPVRETVEFLTEVQESLDGSEKRIQLREHPRRRFEFDLSREEGLERSRVDFLLFDWQSRVFGLPMWHEPVRLTAAASVNDTTLTVDSTAFTDLRSGGLAIVFTGDEAVFDSLQVSSVTATSVTFSSGVQNAYPVGSFVYPVRTAVADGSVRGRRHHVNLGEFQMRFRLTENDGIAGDTSAFSAFNGKVLFDDANFINGTLPEDYRRRIEVFDNETGVLSQDSIWTRNRRGSAKGFITNSRQGVWELRQVLYALKGRQVSFYLPTFYRELIPTADISGASTQITVQNAGYTRFVKNRAPKNLIAVIQTDGTVLTRTVSSSAEVDANTEQLQADVAFPSTIPVADIKRIEFYELVRFDTDRFTIEHQDALGNARLNAPVRVVFE